MLRNTYIFYPFLVFVDNESLEMFPDGIRLNNIYLPAIL